MAGAEQAFAYQRVAALLASELRRGLLRDGDALPPEAELAETFGVGRRTLRRALTMLERDGLIAKRQGRRSIFRSRRIEAGGAVPPGFPAAARMAGLRQTTRLLSVMRRPARLSESLALAIPLSGEVAEIRRLRLVDGRPVIRQLSILPEDIARRLPLEGGGSQSLYALITQFLATQVVVREERVSLARLGPEEAHDLDQAPGEPALLVRRLACDGYGKPLEFSVAAVVSPDISFSLAGVSSRMT